MSVINKKPCVQTVIVIPPAPTTNGNYNLKVAVVDGVATYSWEEI